jgi:hypothetical protein
MKSNYGKKFPAEGVQTKENLSFHNGTALYATSR